MKNFLSVHDVDDLPDLIREAMIVKKRPYAFKTLGENKTLGCLFFNSSLRTRLSTQKAAMNLGMDVLMMNINEEGWKIETRDGVIMDGDKAEHIKEAAAVIGQYCDIIGIRAFASLKDRDVDYSEPIISQFMAYSGVPIISLEGATGHPCQAFADVITIEQYKKVEKPKVVLSWAPHPRALPHAVPNSFAEWAVAAGYEVVITHPEGYELNEKYTRGATIEYNQDKALEGADFVYAKNWSSYTHYGEIVNTNREWTISEAKMALTREAKFMHCLPVRRNMIVTDGVLDGPDSIVIPEAANRVISAQTVLKKMLQALPCL